MLRSRSDPPVAAPPVPTLRLVGPGVEQTLSEPVIIGRDPGCDICLDGVARVSRRHVRLYPEDGAWHAEDLRSANGTFLDGERLTRDPLPPRCTLRLGPDGPEFRIEHEGTGLDEPEDVRQKTDDRGQRTEDGGQGTEDRGRRTEDGGRMTDDGGQRTESSTPILPAARTPGPDASPQPATPSPPHSPTPSPPGSSPLSESEIRRRYFTDDGSPAGERTQFIRRVYQSEQRTQRKRYGLLVAIALGVGLVALGYAAWQLVQTQQLRSSAEELFFQIRQQDLALTSQIAAGTEFTPEQLAELSERRAAAARAYEGFVEELGLYRGLTEEERLIYRVARIFNESEFTIPAGYVREVQRYIRQWERSGRFQAAARHAEEMGYTAVAVNTLRRYGLPPEFYYLVMQESNFNTRAVGPTTRWGIAKGAWQFIPTTGERYGLRIGPRAEERVFDPLDERHDFARAADAAARYMLDISTQLAQASGLLVMASYNWGEHRVGPRLDDLPPPGIERARAAMAGIPMNPQERSYWRFYSTYADRMPDETKGYVMNIVAAAVIGQNPRFFGIDMDNPLAKHLEAPLDPELFEPIDPSADSLTRPVGALPEPEAQPGEAPRRLGSDALRNRR